MPQTIDAEVEQLTFDPATHIYKRSGRVLPSVTQVLSEVGIIDTSWFTELAAWRGSRVHRACELDDLNDLDESSITDDIAGYLSAWRLCKSELLGCNFDHIEEPLALDFAGTPDRIFREPMKRVVDLKTGVIQPWVGLQMVAYSELAFGPSFPGERIAVRLKPDGKYQIQKFPLAERRRDLALFHSALSVYNWRKK